MNGDWQGLDLIGLSKLRFAAPDARRFPCLGLAREALRKGGSLPCALNAADEVAVEAFLAQRLRFSDIPRVIEKVLERTSHTQSFRSLDDVLACDQEARCRARELVTTLVR
jgi:1-deoxy-D-xylulose-5-phosphate reductoisomerase